MTSIPKISTFVSDKATLNTAVTAGASHLIIDSPSVSLRSFVESDGRSDFSMYDELKRMAKEHDPKIEITAHCDLLIHDSQYALLETFLTEIKRVNISSIRIQDPGLIPYLKTSWPECQIHFASELGNHNTLSASYFSEFCSHQSLSNELTHREIKEIIDTSSSSFDILVQGPILIQYSKRPFLSGRTEDTLHVPITKLAHDLDYPGREFIFHENHHGHFMYLYFDRNLLRYIPELMTLGLTHWLIDARGESLNYLETGLRLYKEEQERYLSSPNDWKPNNTAIAEMETTARRDQKPGFFRANKTDNGRKSPYPNLNSNVLFIGTVIDVIKESCITLELENHFSLGQKLIIATPRNKEFILSASSIHTLNKETLTNTHGHTFVQLPWKKGILSNSKCYLSLTTNNE
jgi:collagenase-like PrtC family protease